MPPPTIATADTHRDTAARTLPTDPPTPPVATHADPGTGSVLATRPVAVPFDPRPNDARDTGTTSPLVRTGAPVAVHLARRHPTSVAGPPALPLLPHRSSPESPGGNGAPGVPRGPVQSLHARLARALANTGRAFPVPGEIGPLTAPTVVRSPKNDLVTPGLPALADTARGPPRENHHLLDCRTHPAKRAPLPDTGSAPLCPTVDVARGHANAPLPHLDVPARHPTSIHAAQALATPNLACLLHPLDEGGTLNRAERAICTTSPLIPHPV
jgi:hypothetical protein